MAGLAVGDPATIGSYRLTGRLGQGGQGTVYLAADPGGREVALKVLHPELVADAGLAARFAQEIELARRVARFCTAQILDAGVAGGVPFVVSEYIPGPTLQYAIETGGPLGGGSLERLAIGTATALAAIHGAGIAHRDFKPGNVILGPDGPRVVDFGIARVVTAETTRRGGLIGTPLYMAPELARGEKGGTATDVFAWAATMCYAASGRAPFGADTLPAVLARVLHGEPEIGPMPAALRALVVAGLRKDPADRPTAAALMNALVGTGTPEETPAALGARLAASRPMAPRRRRRPLLLGAALTLVAVLAAGVGYGLSRPGATGTPDRGLPVAGTLLQKRPVLGPHPGGARLLADPNGLNALTSYTVSGVDADVTYVLNPLTGSFDTTRYPEAKVSPDGNLLAAIEGDGSPARTLVLADRRTGAEHRVLLPEPVAGIEWHPDGRSVLATSYVPGELPEATGFVLVRADEPDAAVRIPLKGLAAGTFTALTEVVWAPGGGSVAVLTQRDDAAPAVLRYYSPSGEEVGGFAQTVPGAVGRLDFTSDGTHAAGPCLSAETCVWRLMGDDRAHRPLAEIPDEFHGWYDDDHLLIARTRENTTSLILTDKSGTRTHTLATGPRDWLDLTFSPVLSR